MGKNSQKYEKILTKIEKNSRKNRKKILGKIEKNFSEKSKKISREN